MAGLSGPETTGLYLSVVIDVIAVIISILIDVYNEVVGIYRSDILPRYGFVLVLVGPFRFLIYNF